jgi:riboflavin kinase / FMN adenylyltransferase
LKTINNLKKAREWMPKGSVVTLGNFDGLHLGHVSLIERTLEVTRQKKLPSVLVTFYPNPTRLLGKKPDFKDIFSQDIKRNIINNMGIDYLYTIEFTLEFSEVTAFHFMQGVLADGLNAKHIVIGYDHCFGKSREGNFYFLQKHSEQFGFTVEQLEQVFLDGVSVSSSAIRKHIESGNVEMANKLLNRVFYIRGSVVRGYQRGRTIGFPTANLKIESNQNIIPGDGVYACLVVYDHKLYKGMVNIGNNPTFENQAKSIEGHIFDFSGDLYNKKIELHFIQRHRDGKKFENVQELFSQLRKDETAIRQLLKDY